MSAIQPVVVRTAPGPAIRAARTVAWVVPLMLLGALVAFVLTGHPPPSLKLIVAGGIALLGVLALAITRFDSAVFLGFLLMSIVLVQPGPPDIVFAVVFAVAVASGTPGTYSARQAAAEVSTPVTRSPTSTRRARSPEST